MVARRREWSRAWAGLCLSCQVRCLGLREGQEGANVAGEEKTPYPEAPKVAPVGRARGGRLILPGEGGGAADIGGPAVRATQRLAQGCPQGR
jgi:hypothetical protein